MNRADAVAGLVRRWTALHTGSLPEAVAADRRAELASDLFEQQAEAERRRVPAALVSLSILRRLLLGMAADVRWRQAQLRVARTGHAHTERLDGRVVMIDGRSMIGRVRQRLGGRRCLACGERYRRTLPYCPVCKTRKGHDGIPHDPKWGSGAGFGF